MVFDGVYSALSSFDLAIRSVVSQVAVALVSGWVRLDTECGCLIKVSLVEGDPKTASLESVHIYPVN